MSRRRVVSNEKSTVQQVQDELRMKKKHIKRVRRRRFLKRLFIVFLLLFFISGAIYVDTQPFSKVQQFEVSGNHFINSDIIKEQSGVKINDRLITTYGFLINGRLSKTPGIALSDSTVYYTSGLISLSVKEKEAIGYLDDGPSVIFEDNAIYVTTAKDYISLPVFIGFTKEQIELHPDLASKLSRMNETAFNNISEIHYKENEYESLYLELVMNNGFKVYTSVENLLLMNHYVEMVSSILSGDNPNNRCIYFLDYYEDMPDSQVSIAKPCAD